MYCQSIYSQAPGTEGKPVAEIFTDLHVNLVDSSRTSGFALNRAHLGYKFTPVGNFTALIMINVGSPDDLAPGALPRRYAFFREASVTYIKDKLAVSFGMVSTRTFDYQQGFWGKRFLGPEFQATYGYGTVADLGVVLDYKLNSIFKFDLALLNGKGYSNIQVDNSLKQTAGLTISLPDKISFRLYGDIMRIPHVWQTTLIGFAGFKNDLLSIGVEGSYKTNLDSIQGHDVWGISGTASIYLSRKSEIFARYDYMASLYLPQESLEWDYMKDGIYLIAGYQRSLSDNLRIALNYRRMDPYYAGRQITNAIYLNAWFKF